MEDYGKNIIKISAEELLTTVMGKKQEQFRLAQICSVYKEGKYELFYSFAKDYELVNYKLTVEEKQEVPSITSVYEAAFLYENEIKELFGVNIEFISLDYQNKLYRISEETPFVKKEEK